MKKIVGLLLLIIALSFSFGRSLAQKNDPMLKRWRQLEAVANDNQPRQALAILDTITDIARKEHRKDEIIRVAAYRLVLQKIIQDEGPGYYIPYLDSLIGTASDSVEFSLLTLLKADYFVSVYQNDMRNINNRTSILGGEPDEAKIAYWTTADFQKKIHELFTAALIPARQLQEIPYKKYSAILYRGSTPLLRPTLYDLVVQDAIEYYASGLAAATLSEDKYSLKDVHSLDGPADFIHHRFEKPDASDSLNPDWLLLGYYRDLEAFHLKDKNGAALADAYLQRLAWAYRKLPEALTVTDNSQRSVIMAKEDLYRQSLEKFISSGDPDAMDEVFYGAYLLANTYVSDARQYRAGEDTAHRYGKVKALQIIGRYQPQLDRAVRAVAGTKDSLRLGAGAAVLLNLKADILRRSLNIQMESFNIPNAPMRALISFSNVRKLYFRILRTPVSVGYLDFTDSLWRNLQARTPLLAFSQNMPLTGDHQVHSVEIKVPALKAGAYILLASADPDFKIDSMLSAGTFSVTNLAFLVHGKALFLMDRQTGMPVQGADVSLYDRVWSKGKDIYIQSFSGKTDREGKVSVTAGSMDQSVLNAVYKGDSLTSSLFLYRSYTFPDADTAVQKEMIFYLDRSIYRPGQVVEFKGIATTLYPDERGRKLWTDDKPHRVYLYDANDQIQDSLLLKLNPYGALSGRFTLPVGLLPGNYSLVSEDLDGRQSFKVEDYKRPTYFLSMDTVKDAVYLGDSVTVRGKAMAYSGYPVSDAKVEVRVSRNIYFPYSWYRYLPVAPAAAVAHGTAMTDEKGNFSFTFKAAAGEKNWNRFMPDYRYSIEATATDQNGETRTAASTVVVGTQPFHLIVDITDGTAQVQVDSLKLITQTAAGVFTPQQVTLRITQIIAPQRLLRSRLWSAPDLSVTDSTDFVRDFPHDPYMDETNRDLWVRGKVVYTQQLTTSEAGKIGLKSKLAPGWYELEADAPGVNGQTIRDKKYLCIYNPASPLLSPAYHWSEAGKSAVLPGEGTGIALASSAKGQYVTYSITKMVDKKSALNYRHVTLQGKPVILPVSLSKKDIAGAKLDYAFVRDNRPYSGSLTIGLKDTTTLPQIVYDTYRDKTEPGSKEHWTLHINKGSERLKDMELLSAMYDASLDQFTPHNWSLPGMESGQSLEAWGWSNDQGFQAQWARVHSYAERHYWGDKNYARFIYHDLLSNGHGGWLPSRPRVMELAAATMTAGNIGAADKIRIRGVRSESLNDVVVVGYGTQAKKEIVGAATLPSHQPVRSDFRETVFFYPYLHSDEKGDYRIDFQMPDALTSWKWLNLAYDKDLHMVTGFKEIISQKTLMVSPNLPRFVRNGDQWTLPVKVINLSEEDMASTVKVDIRNPATGKELLWGPAGTPAAQTVTVKAGESLSVGFGITVPEDFTGPVAITVRASGGKYSDAEKNMLPVLTNKIQVTESLPFYIREDGEKTFTMDPLFSLSGMGTEKNSKGHDKQSQKLVLELTTNPIWNVVMALPDVHISDQPDGLALIDKLYADAMGNYVIGAYPEIARVIHSWSDDTASAENKTALLSALEKNPELKSVLLEQTPWVMDARDETAQHKALVRFFNKAVLDSSQRALVARLLSLQQADGGFSWFSGGRTDPAVTQRIYMYINQLQQGRLKDESLAVPLLSIADRAAGLLKAQYTAQYEQWQQQRKDAAGNRKPGMPADTLYPVGPMEIQYLYAISFSHTSRDLDTVQRFFLRQETYGWQGRSVYLQLMIAAAQYRIGDRDFAVNTIVKSLLDRTVRSPALGMYWKWSAGFYNWFENPLQAQALAINVLTEMTHKGEHPEWKSFIAELQRYLIGRKQVNRWPASISTIDACVAMIDAAPENLVAARQVDVTLGGQQLDLKKQTGTGYMRYEVKGPDVRPSMGQLKVRVKGLANNVAIPVYGALYWQYLSPIRAVEAAGPKPGITLGKSLFREVNTAGGRQLIAVKATDQLHVGDKLVSRLTITLDRDMDYVHLREMRAGGVQPDQNISGYQFREGLSYYQAISDLTTDMYFDHIGKGAYVIEYPVHVSHAGSFAAGTATMESFYAPEFATHTEGVRIEAVPQQP